MRPIYETEKTKLEEARFMASLENKLCLKAKKQPVKNEIDFSLSNGNDHVIGMVEVRCRNIEHDRYPDYMVSLHKVKSALQWSVFFPVKLYVRWVDAYGRWDFTKWNEGACYIREGGMYSRNDPDDEEPCLYIPRDQFDINDINLLATVPDDQISSEILRGTRA